MTYLILKAVISGFLIAIASEVARRWPGWGALIVSLPLVSVLAMLWLWRDTHDPVRMAAHVEATFWFVIPSLPMFLLIPSMLRRAIRSGSRCCRLRRDRRTLSGDDVDRAEIRSSIVRRFEMGVIPAKAEIPVPFSSRSSRLRVNPFFSREDAKDAKEGKKKRDSASAG